MKTKSKFTIAALCFVLAVSCCSKSDSEQQFVGVTEFEFHLDATDRDMKVNVWYPAKEQSGATPYEFIADFPARQPWTPLLIREAPLTP
jgi:hypothetical protein